MCKEKAKFWLKKGACEWDPPLICSHIFLTRNVLQCLGGESLLQSLTIAEWKMAKFVAIEFKPCLGR